MYVASHSSVFRSSDLMRAYAAKMDSATRCDKRSKQPKLFSDLRNLWLPRSTYVLELRPVCFLLTVLRQAEGHSFRRVPKSPFLLCIASQSTNLFEQLSKEFLSNVLSVVLKLITRAFCRHWCRQSNACWAAHTRCFMRGRTHIRCVSRPCPYIFLSCLVSLVRMKIAGCIEETCIHGAQQILSALQ